MVFIFHTDSNFYPAAYIVKYIRSEEIREPQTRQKLDTKDLNQPQIKQIFPAETYQNRLTLIYFTTNLAIIAYFYKKQISQNKP